MSEESEIEAKSGIIKWFDYKKGYGFITPDEKADERDVFLHISALEKADIKKIEEGQHVLFTTYKDRKRIAAYIVQILN